MVKKPDKQTRDKMSRVAAMGCIICKMPTEIHHLLGAGMGLKSEKFIGLCSNHHRNGGNGKLAIHAGTKTWEAKYGTQVELWELVERMICNI